VDRANLEVGGESFDPRQLDMLAPENLHVQQVVRAGRKRRASASWSKIARPDAPAGFKEFPGRGERDGR